jgi:hypothetical protein
MPSQIAFTDRLIVSVGGNTEEIARERAYASSIAREPPVA